MSQVITIPQLSNQLENLKNEVRNLRSLVVGTAIKDKEGQYKTSFIKRVLQASSQSASYGFTDKKSFLAHLKNHD